MHQPRQAPMPPPPMATMHQPGALAAAARGGMAGPQGPTARGARILSARMGAAPPPERDIFASMATMSADTLVAPLENIQTDANSLRAFTIKLEGISPEGAQTWKQGVEMLLAQMPGPREVMQKLQTYFGIKPVEIDMCVKMLGIRRIDLGVHDLATRRNRTLAVAALGLYATGQAQAILSLERLDPKLNRTCTQRLRDAMAKGNVHAQLVLNLMKDARSGPRI